MVNDICGFADPEMPRVCEEYDVAVAKMASPPDLERPGAVEETDWAARKSPEWAQAADYVDQVYEALKQNGLTDKTIIDPAFGGWVARPRRSRTIARRSDGSGSFARSGDRCWSRSTGRTSSARSQTGRPRSDFRSALAATAMAVERGAHVIRTHDGRNAGRSP